MTHPEKNASYSYKPKFIERMKRAEGGITETGSNPDLWTRDPEAEMRSQAGGITGLVQGAKDWGSDAADTINSIVTGEPEHLGTDAQSRNMQASTKRADTEPEGRAHDGATARGRKPLNHGGRVRKGD